MSGSSSTIRRLGRGSSGMGFDAFQEGALQRRFPVALAQSARRAGISESSPVKDGHIVANLLDVCERMRGEKQSSPLRNELQDQFFRAGTRLGVQAAHRFVQDVEIALRKKAGGEPQLLGHALGISAHRLVEGGDVQVERGEHRADAYLFVSAFEQPQPHRYELATGEKIGSDEPLVQKREPGARLRAAMRDAVDFDRARVEVAKVEQALDQCGLAGAVHTGQAQAIARGNIEIDPAQHFGAAKALAHSEESNQRLGHKPALRGEASMIAQRRRPFTVDLRMPHTGDGLRSELSPRTFSSARIRPLRIPSRTPWRQAISSRSTMSRSATT